MLFLWLLQCGQEWPARAKTVHYAALLNANYLNRARPVEVIYPTFCPRNLILHQKCRFLTKEKRRKSLTCSVLLILTFGSSGATRK